MTQINARPVKLRDNAPMKTDVTGLTMNGSPAATPSRLAREWETMKAMVRIYCRDHHHSTVDRCEECGQFLSYASLRLERCHFGQEKPTCARCPVHCYQRERREQVRVIMRYAGPRMLWEHPVLTARHWLDGLFSKPKTSAR